MHNSLFIVAHYNTCTGPNYRVGSVTGNECGIQAESCLSMFVLLGAVKSLVLQPYDSIDKSASSHFMRLCW